MEARDQLNKTGNKCTTRRGCAGCGREAAHKHGAIVRAHLADRAILCKMATLLPFCEMRVKLLPF